MPGSRRFLPVPEIALFSALLLGPSLFAEPEVSQLEERLSAARGEERLEVEILPADPATIDPETIEANRERWIAEWTELARS